jgi:hypothetical protein
MQNAELLIVKADDTCSFPKVSKDWSYRVNDTLQSSGNWSQYCVDFTVVPNEIDSVISETTFLAEDACLLACWGKFLRKHEARLPNRRSSSYPSQWEPQISQITFFYSFFVYSLSRHEISQSLHKSRSCVSRISSSSSSPLHPSFHVRSK